MELGHPRRPVWSHLRSISRLATQEAAGSTGARPSSDAGGGAWRRPPVFHVGLGLRRRAHPELERRESEPLVEGARVGVDLKRVEAQAGRREYTGVGDERL